VLRSSTARSKVSATRGRVKDAGEEFLEPEGLRHVMH
jgi:hypothetical protein